jgi:LysM repeat protein
VISHSTASQAGQGAAQSGTSTVVVQPGQTLWGVARALTPDADVRETVARIQELNGLTGASVHPGQSLIVPVIG